METIKKITTPLHVKETELNIEVSKFSKFDILNGIDNSVFNKYSPGVYTFYDDKKIYIGEAHEPMSRLKSHASSNKLEDHFQGLLFRSGQFNKSAVYDIETKLIDYMAADGSRELINKDLSQKSHEYFLKKTYQSVVENIWDTLKENGIAKYKIQSIEDMEIYKLSPFKSLNLEQAEVVEYIEKSNDEKLIVINGYPGTGKSIVASTLFKNLSIDNKVAMTSGTKPITKSFKKVFARHLKNHPEDNIDNAPAIIKDNTIYDYLIIDEAHRLKHNNGYQYAQGTIHMKQDENELELLMTKAKKVIVFYDPNQYLRAGDIPAKVFTEMFVKRNPKTFELKEQMRVNDGFEFINFINEFLDGKEIKYASNEDYDFRVFDSFKEMYAVMKSYSAKTSLVRLTAGNTRLFLSDPRKDRERKQFDFDIDGVKLKWNKSQIDWLDTDAAKNLEEVAYYNTIQGFDLNYNGVIIGKDLYLDSNGKLQIDEKHIANQYDKDRKDIENRYELLRQKVINRYRVLLTRATKGTLIYVEDKNLRDKLKSLIAIESEGM